MMARYEQPWTTYYFIAAGGNNIGAIRIIDRKDGFIIDDRIYEKLIYECRRQA